MFRNWERSSPGRDENQSLSGELLLFFYLPTQSRQTIYSPDLRKSKGREHMKPASRMHRSQEYGALPRARWQDFHLSSWSPGISESWYIDWETQTALDSARVVSSVIRTVLSGPYDWQHALTSPPNTPLFLKLDGKLGRWDLTPPHPHGLAWNKGFFSLQTLYIRSSILSVQWAQWKRLSSAGHTVSGAPLLRSSRKTAI